MALELGEIGGRAAALLERGDGLPEARVLLAQPIGLGRAGLRLGEPCAEIPGPRVRRDELPLAAIQLLRQRGLAPPPLDRGLDPRPRDLAGRLVELRLERLRAAGRPLLLLGRARLGRARAGPRLAELGRDLLLERPGPRPLLGEGPRRVLPRLARGRGLRLGVRDRGTRALELALRARRRRTPAPVSGAGSRRRGQLRPPA